MLLKQDLSVVTITQNTIPLTRGRSLKKTSMISLTSEPLSILSDRQGP